MEQKDDRLSKRNLWTFTLASIGRDTAAGLFSSYLLTFVLYTKNLTDAQFTLISMGLVFARIFDGFNDPLMGNVLEVTRTRWGKFKPWILIGMLGSSIIFFFSFNNNIQGWPYAIFFILIFLIYDLFFTMNDIGYWGMIPALATRKEDRDRLTSRTVLFAGIGGALVGLIVPTFTAGDLTIGGSAVTAYRVIAIIFIAMFVGGQIITLVGVKEKPLPPKGQGTVDKVGLKPIINTIKNNDQLMWSLVIFLVSSVGRDLVVGGLGINYIFFEFGYNGFLFTIFSALGAAATGVVMLFFTSISKKFNRNQLMRFATFSVVGGSALMLLVGLLVPASAGMIKFAALVFSNIFVFGGQYIYYLIVMVCIANTVEYNEWKTGTRAEGIIFSARPFITKVSWAIVNLMVLIIFLLTGVRKYTNQIADLENAADAGRIDAAAKSSLIEGILAQIPSGKNYALLACMTIIPAALGIVSYVLYQKKFTITEERYEEILVELKERRGELPEED